MFRNLLQPPDRGVIEALHFLRRIYESIHTESQRNTERGHWISEAFVVRLWAVLEAHRIVGARTIVKSLDGADEVRVCRMLRNQIAHSKAEITGAKARHLDRTVRRVFKLGDQKSLFEGKFVLSKDTVLRPMHEACLRYSHALLDKHAA